FGEFALSRGEMVAIYIHPRHARRGIGTRMFRELEHIANAHGIAALKLSSSLGAVRFYERLGFVPGAPSVHRLGNGAEIPCIPMSRPGA
ncbi:MAG: GNAT family N-acetyltransferase, partial [Betaproteobacteria bacterium]|nr:GNAT family N-acetyltransferase [Betaproteobacteria bacterium]